MRVLVVDDSPAVRRRITARLREIPEVEHVDEATDVGGALAAAEAGAPQLVVLDLHLRGCGALDVLTSLKRVAAPPAIAVLTNDASEHHRRECIARGADYFFDKSKEFEALVQVASVLAHNARST
jgi:DNA-binding NarL/FixJ family response regulator